MLKNITVKVPIKIVQFTIDYQADDETGLPSEVEYDKLINRVFKILTQPHRTSKCIFFAGHFICNSQIKIHFIVSMKILL